MVFCRRFALYCFSVILTRGADATELGTHHAATVLRCSEVGRSWSPVRRTSICKPSLGTSNPLNSFSSITTRSLVLQTLLLYITLVIISLACGTSLLRSVFLKLCFVFGLFWLYPLRGNASAPHGPLAFAICHVLL